MARIGYKSVWALDSSSRLVGKAIVTLSIPEDAQVAEGLPLTFPDSGGHLKTLHKKRASKATVLKIDPVKFARPKLERSPVPDECYVSDYSMFFALSPFEYKVGETVEPREPFSPGNGSCGSGIHFFDTREEAEQW